jgi:hypothetical protein
LTKIDEPAAQLPPNEVSRSRLLMKVSMSTAKSAHNLLTMDE